MTNSNVSCQIIIIFYNTCTFIHNNKKFNPSGLNGTNTWGRGGGPKCKAPKAPHFYVIRKYPTFFILLDTYLTISPLRRGMDNNQTDRQLSGSQGSIFTSSCSCYTPSIALPFISFQSTGHFAHINVSSYSHGKHFGLVDTGQTELEREYSSRQWGVT
jgi:hypothetical protein